MKKSTAPLAAALTITALAMAPATLPATATAAPASITVEHDGGTHTISTEDPDTAGFEFVPSWWPSGKEQRAAMCGWFPAAC